MDIDSHFSVTRANGASSARRLTSASGTFSDQEISAAWPGLQQALQGLPDSRPEAVERARRLIADPDYPPPDLQEILAQQLAVLLTSEIDPLPT
jgi:hypothetical protein